MGLIRYSCSHISGHHEPIHVKSGVWGFLIMLYKNMVMKMLKCKKKKKKKKKRKFDEVTLQYTLLNRSAMRSCVLQSCFRALSRYDLVLIVTGSKIKVPAIDSSKVQTITHYLKMCILRAPKYKLSPVIWAKRHKQTISSSSILGIAMGITSNFLTAQHVN